MASVKRHKTDYKGVFYIEGKEPSTGQPERIYYIRYYKKGKSVEEKAGRQIKDRMTPAKANRLRVLRLTGKADSNNEKREKKRAVRNRKTVERLWEAFYEHKRSNRSINDDRNRWRRYLQNDFGHKLPEEIVTTDIDRLRAKLEDRGLAPATVKQGLVLLKRILNFGVKRGLCSPIDMSKAHFEMPKLNNITTEDLTKEQLESLLYVLKTDPNRMVANMMLLALYTGMRKGEIYRLKWEHVDFERGFIFIKDPKGKVDQHIPLNSSARALLEEQMHSESEYVFYGKNKGQLREVQSFRRLCQEAGLPDSFRPMHGLRHVFASTLASSGKVDMYTLQKLLTHKTPSMVQRYAHLRDDALKNASEVIGEMF